MWSETQPQNGRQGPFTNRSAERANWSAGVDRHGVELGNGQLAPRSIEGTKAKCELLFPEVVSHREPKAILKKKGKIEMAKREELAIALQQLGSTG